MSNDMNCVKDRGREGGLHIYRHSESIMRFNIPTEVILGIESCVYFIGFLTCGYLLIVVVQLFISYITFYPIVGPILIGLLLFLHIWIQCD